MAGPGRTFRVFISSTFSDFVAERNILQEQVFPALQKLCAAHGCRFQAVDLRWGVSEEAALDQQTVNICLTELKRCQDVSPRPNFIILLGDRYGWMPLPPQIEASEFAEILTQLPADDQTRLTEWYQLDTNAVPPEYVLRPRREEVPAEADYESWGNTEQALHALLLDAVNRLGWPLDDERRIKYQCSATHQEIIEGALQLPDEREHVFAFLRTIGNADQLPTDSPYLDAGMAQARTLKETIRRQTGVTHFNYPVVWTGVALDATHLAQFAADVLASLTRILEEEFRQLQQLDDLTREEIAHQEFGAERCRHFVGRQQILNDIAAYLQAEHNTPLVIYGPSGSGKSALMAKAVLNASVDNKHACIIQRFIGATPASADIRTLLFDLCRELTRSHQGDVNTIPTEYKDLKENFAKRLELSTGDKPLILFLDALDQLSATDNAHSLNWLPATLPANVKVVVSVLEREDAAGLCLISARSKRPRPMLLRLEEMTLAEGSAALDAWLAEEKRTLTEDQRGSVLSGFRHCPLPLYLKLAFEEARRWKSYDELPCGADDVPGLAADVPGVIGDMLTRLRDKRQHGEVLVTTFLGLLSAARHGLSETEILELLSEDAAVMADLKARSARSPEASGIPAVVWLRLYHDLAPYLMERSADATVLYNFYHRQVDETVKVAYLTPEYHAQLARYFSDDNQRPLWSGEGTNRKPNLRRCAELPYQLSGAEMWDELVASLTDLDFIEAKSKAGMVYDLVADYNRSERALPEGQEERRKEEMRQERIKDYVDRLIAHSADPDRIPLPDPPATIPWQAKQTITERHGDWSLLEQVKAWGYFVVNHIRLLVDGEESVFQMAWNSTDTGPVAERVAEMQDESNGFSGEWLRLRNRPLFTPHPLRLKKLDRHTGIVAVSITPDGRRAVSGAGGDRAFNVWNLETGESQVMQGHAEKISSVSITPDGRLAVSAGGILFDFAVRIWDLETGESRSLQGHWREVMAVSITPDGRHAVSGSDDNTIRVWNLETGESRVLKGHTGKVMAVSITPDGRRVVSGADGSFDSQDYALRIWDLETGESRVLKGHTRSVNAVSITPDGRLAVSGSEDGTVRVWNLATGDSRVLEGHARSVNAVSVSADGRCAVWGGGTACGNRDGTLRTCELETGESRALEECADSVYSISITPDGRRAVSGSPGGRLELWDLEMGESRVMQGHTDSVLAVAISAVGHRAVSGAAGGYDSQDYALRIWDLETGESRALQGHTSSVRAVAITPDGCLAVSGADSSFGSQDSALRRWDMETGKSRVLQGHTGTVWAVAITPDGRRAVSGSYDNTLRVWDLETSESRALQGHRSSIRAVSITPDGRRAVSGSEDFTVRLWDLETGKSRRVLQGLTSTFTVIAITPEGRRAVIGNGETLQVWDFTTSVSLVLKGHHTNWVKAVLVTPDGRRAVSGSDDKTLRVWDLETGACLQTLKGHTHWVNAVSITPDGCHVVSGSADKTLRVWDLATGECIVVCTLQGEIGRMSMFGINLIVGETNGQVGLLNIENDCIGNAVVTAVRLWLFDHHVWDANLTAQCHWCGQRFVVKDQWIGQEINCPVHGCGKPLKFNSFVCDPSAH